MQKFRKKPVVIDAIQLTKSNIKEVYQIVNKTSLPEYQGVAEVKWCEYEDIVKEKGMSIFTLEDGPDKRAKHVASIGDWVIKGIQGEFYPVKPDIFEATYEKVEEN